MDWTDELGNIWHSEPDHLGATYTVTLPDGRTGCGWTKTIAMKAALLLQAALGMEA
jgi:hypothetical protein